MVNFFNHTTDAWSIFHFNNLRNLTEPQSQKCTLLVYRISNSTLNLFDFYCCHVIILFIR